MHILVHVFLAKNCATDIDECDTDPCENNGGTRAHASCGIVIAMILYYCAYRDMLLRTTLLQVPSLSMSL